ncbi:U3 small nucleolar RNA-associated protein 15 homolog [Watersipora subatra]|uniref:U3 small nucleolar RNA-associated protein 15 homolog n=1 Tax=Watersipora subatra TaxID=2589382 RepID=UPI00355BD34D
MAAPSTTLFKKTPIRASPKIQNDENSAGAEYWKSFEFPITKKEYGPITDVQFSPTEPYQYAVTSSTRVQIYSCETNQIVKTFSKFKEVVHCSRYRRDGKLLLAGTEAGMVKVYNIENKSCLRMLRGHRSAVHGAQFLMDGYRIVTCSDDQMSLIWDLASGEKLCSFHEHKDNVRCCTVNPAATDVILTGSYDTTAKLLDVRTKSCVQTVCHGAPIEDVIMFNSGTIYMTAGGSTVRVWDALAGGKLLMELANHHKTVMSISFAKNYTQFLTAGLDRHVKVHDSSTYQVVHTMDFPAPLLSVGCSGDSLCFAAGMADGMLSVRRRTVDGHLTKQEKRSKAFQFKLAKHSFKPSKDAHVIQHERKVRLASYDSLLKGFQHSKALDAVLESKVRLVHPEVTVGIIEELIRRDTIKPAIAGRDEKSLETLLRFLAKHISNSQYTKTLVDVADVILDVYSESPDRLATLIPRLMSLSHVVNSEVKYEEQLLQLLGTMDAILSMSHNHQYSDTNNMCLLDKSSDNPDKSISIG